jgi:hypothetical protein
MASGSSLSLSLDGCLTVSTVAERTGRRATTPAMAANGEWGKVQGTEGLLNHFDRGCPPLVSAPETRI